MRYEGIGSLAQLLASFGRGRDTLLAHITPGEAKRLKKDGGSGTVNPITGLLEFEDGGDGGGVGNEGGGEGHASSDATNNSNQGGGSSEGYGGEYAAPGADPAPTPPPPTINDLPLNITQRDPSWYFATPSGVSTNVFRPTYRNSVPGAPQMPAWAMRYITEPNRVQGANVGLPSMRGNFINPGSDPATAYAQGSPGAWSNMGIASVRNFWGR